jgi:hypothetical protein
LARPAAIIFLISTAAIGFHPARHSKSALDELFSCLVISIHFGQAERSLHRAGMQQSVEHDVLRNDARAR